MFDDDKSDEEQEVHQLEPLDVIEKRAKVFASFSFNEIIDTYKFEHGTIYSFWTCKLKYSIIPKELLTTNLIDKTNHNIKLTDIQEPAGKYDVYTFKFSGTLYDLLLQHYRCI